MGYTGHEVRYFILVHLNVIHSKCLKFTSWRCLKSHFLFLCTCNRHWRLDSGHISFNSVEFISSSLVLTVNTNVAPPLFEFCVKPNYPLNIIVITKTHVTLLMISSFMKLCFYEVENGFCVYKTKKIQYVIWNIQ